MFDCNLIFSSHRGNKLYMQSGAVTDRKGGADLHQHWVSRSCSRVKQLVRCRKVNPCAEGIVWRCFRGGTHRRWEFAH